MAMEKYGVEDPAQQQKVELHQVNNQLQALDSNLEKTAAEDSEFSRLTARKAELEATIRSHDQ